VNPRFKPGLYAITPQRHPDGARLADEIRQALQGGAAMVQFRDKSGDAAWRYETAAKLRALCEEFGAPFIVNDDVALTAFIGAAGVHLGREDAALPEARAALGPDALIGVSCYDSLECGRAAAAQGADYLAFGSVFPSATKAEAVHCPLATLTRARSLGVPVVAIGGITSDNGRAAIDAGADALAVINAVFEAPDVRHAAESFSSLWAR
jgi:thiamine-phosphate pyrophosphorylase